ncbi:hypothetical protein [Labedaea rhizosphaerae]|nr:hypothetical protein [Labedaea rhizosphaerae]
MILAGFVLAIVVTGGEHGPAGGPSVPSARVTHCQAGEEVNDPCSRT